MGSVKGCDWKEKERKDYTFRRQFHGKPSIELVCPGVVTTVAAARAACWIAKPAADS